MKGNWEPLEISNPTKHTHLFIIQCHFNSIMSPEIDTMECRYKLENERYELKRNTYPGTRLKYANKFVQ